MASEGKVPPIQSDGQDHGSGEESSEAEEMPAQKLATLRSGRKGAITKHLSALRRLVAERDIDGVQSRLSKLKSAFQAFDSSHEMYSDFLTSVQDQEQNDQYYIQVETAYSEGVKSAYAWLDSVAECKAVHSTASASPQPNLSADFAKLLTIPPVQLDVFTGNPLDYKGFITIFDESVDSKLVDDQQKLTRLLQFTSGPAKAAIRNCALIGGSKGYNEAREILHSRFGNDHLVCRKIIENLKVGRVTHCASQMQSLADDLSMAKTALESLGLLGEVDNQQFILQILSKCPENLQHKWHKRALSHKNAHGTYPGFEDFVEMVSKLAKDWSDPIYGKDALKLFKQAHTPKSISYHVTSVHGENLDAPSSTAPRTESGVIARPCVVCSEIHRLWQCGIFKSKQPNERFQIVKDNKLCFNCLRHSHSSRECRRQSMCGVPNCVRKHSRFLHGATMNNVTRSNPTVATPTVNSTLNADNAARAAPGPVDSGSGVNCCTKVRDGRTVYLPTVAIEVNGIRTYAMLDNCSTDSFMTQSLAKRLRLPLNRESCTYVINTVLGSEQRESPVVDVNVASVGGSFKGHIANMLVLPQVPNRYLPSHININDYVHLTDIDLSPVPPGAQVEMLIGQDNPDMICPLDFRINPQHPKDPYATKSVFGWCLNGIIGETSTVREISANFIRTDIECNVDKLWQIECNDLSGDSGLSIEDHKVISLWEKSLERIDGHYCLPIPWRNDKPELPNNKALACHRLDGLNKRLAKQGLSQAYDENIKVMINKGYAEPVPESQLNLEDGKVFYLPHHPVLNKKGKVRPVFDCAAKYQGISLNSQCLQGPDLINKLIGVLLRFRQYKYAITADIEAMYLQVKIPEHDRNALRFLWYNDERKLTEYRMTSHLFGGVWSSSSSAYALRHTVAECQPDPLIADTILNSFYVDDLLKSVQYINEGIHVIHGVKQVVGHGGFNLTKFTVNNDVLLQEIDTSDRAAGVKEIAPELFSKSLGLTWEVFSDTFRYTSKAMVGHLGPVTRRQMLSYVSSLYDPLGLISPVILEGKVLFQQATAMKLEWDTAVPSHLQAKWWAWHDSLLELENLKINRCVVPETFLDGVFELHNFCDASTSSYGSCTYLRVITADGRIHVALVASKGRLAPLKTISVPRLELSAAVTAAKLDQLVRKHFELHTIDSKFWSDSEIVLGYIRNESRRFHTFVANRVAQIRQISEPSQWMHVPGKSNPADVISRGAKASQLPQIWFSGPDFLWDHKSNWPESHVMPDVSSNDPEVKADVSTFAAQILSDDVTVTIGLEALINFYSSYYKLKKAICWFNRFIAYIKCGRADTGPISQLEMCSAEKQLLGHVQRQFFSKELNDLYVNGKVKVSSPLIKLSPKLDQELIVVGGRLHEAPVASTLKHPVILPRDHRLSHLIVLDVHNDAHLGVEWVFSKLRQKYWITHVRALVKKVKRSCIVCRKLYAGPMTQLMANLPASRCAPFERPFSSSGVDLFGPFLVTVGRAKVKRWACVYSCFTSRAIHIEKLDDLTTDAFINGLVRFVARRGPVKRIQSDNGTNMVGAHNELTRAFRSFDRCSVIREARRRNIDWVFNPPHASHHGGLWERMIRTVRRILIAILSPSTRLTDEILVTVLCEAENIVNSRPLTKCSDDASDSDPLTPNHFLMQSGNYALPWAHGIGETMYQRRWRHVQMLINHFWKRWLKDYLPQLNRRQKWLVQVPNVKVGDVVLILDEQVPRGKWPLGKVLNVNLGRDGLVRSVLLKTKSSQMVRPISKLVYLEGALEASS